MPWPVAVFEPVPASELGAEQGHTPGILRCLGATGGPLQAGQPTGWTAKNLAKTVPLEAASRSLPPALGASWKQLLTPSPEGVEEQMGLK